MSERQKNSTSKTQIPQKSATRWQGRHLFTRLFWILIAFAIALGLAFLPRNQESPVTEINWNYSPSELRLYEPGMGLSL